MGFLILALLSCAVFLVLVSAIRGRSGAVRFISVLFFLFALYELIVLKKSALAFDAFWKLAAAFLFAVVHLILALVLVIRYRKW